MNLNEKIKQILTDKNISPSYFADEIGIQRSSVSHILAGRNKPSLDIVQKIIRRFPELGMEWILDDVELPIVNPEPQLVREQSSVITKRDDEPVRSELREKNISDQLTGYANLPELKNERTQEKQAEKKIERVMLFFSDGTFQEFRH
jgi:transcriptional regulator with XRE-family HTH domain